MPISNNSSSNDHSAAIDSQDQQRPPAPRQGIKRALPLHAYTDKSGAPATTATASQASPPQVQIQPVVPLRTGTDKTSEHSECASATENCVESAMVPDNDTVLVSRIRTMGGLEISFREDEGGWLIVRVQRFA